jgi:hypothetical protein
MKPCSEHQTQANYCAYCVIEYLTMVNYKHKERIKKLNRELFHFKAIEKAKAMREARDF